MPICVILFKGTVMAVTEIQGPKVSQHAKTKLIYVVGGRDGKATTVQYLRLSSRIATPLNPTRTTNSRAP